MKKIHGVLLSTALTFGLGCGEDLVDQKPWELSESNGGQTDEQDRTLVRVTTGEFRDVMAKCLADSGLNCDTSISDGVSYGEKFNQCATGCSLEVGYGVFQQDRFSDSINKYEVAEGLNRLYGLECSYPGQVDLSTEGHFPPWATGAPYTVEAGFIPEDRMRDEESILFGADLDRIAEVCKSFSK